VKKIILKQDLMNLYFNFFKELDYLNLLTDQLHIFLDSPIKVLAYVRGDKLFLPILFFVFRNVNSKCSVSFAFNFMDFFGLFLLRNQSLADFLYNVNPPN
jgi:hypothetical protein